MNDMTAVIVPKSDQINADDLISGPMTVTIQGVAITAGTEQPVSIDIGLPGKVYRPCKSMSRVLVAAWGPDAKQYTGRTMTLYRDPTVKWGGLDVGGIRISHLSNIERDMTMALTATRAQRKPYTVKALKAAPKPETPPSTPAEGAATDLGAWAADVRERIATATDASTRPFLLTWWNSPAEKRRREPMKTTETFAEVFREFTAHIDKLRLMEETVSDEVLS
jgi:hypothetical protein